MLTCRDCGKTKDISLFKKERSNKRGYTTLCKNCANKQQREILENNIRVEIKRRWHGIRQRCNNPNEPSYHNYGGRGISVCQEWLDNPDTFIDWCLENGFDRKLTIDRIDNNGNYTPENCRFISRKEQLMNTRTNVTDIVNDTRICGVCKIEKPLTDFHRQTRDHAGRRYVCKECRRVRP